MPITIIKILNIKIKDSLIETGKSDEAKEAEKKLNQARKVYITSRVTERTKVNR